MPQNFCEITTLDLSYEVPVKSTVEISQNFVAFSEYMNFTAVTKSTTFPSCLASASCYIYEPLQSAFLALEISYNMSVNWNGCRFVLFCFNYSEFLSQSTYTTRATPHRRPNSYPTQFCNGLTSFVKVVFTLASINPIYVFKAQ